MLGSYELSVGLFPQLNQLERIAASFQIFDLGGAILRRLEPIATVRIPVSRLPPLLRGGSKTQNTNPENAIDDGDIPRAVPPKKPVRQ